jgi:TM2 domain-containing membrane protein YozV
MNKMCFFCLIWHVFKLDLPCILKNRKVLSLALILVLSCCFSPSKTYAVEVLGLDTVICELTIVDESASELILEKKKSRPNPILQLFNKKRKKNKRITAAILAFPFPFGIVGLHRIYLGTAPYVPVAYIASLGGIFGILPFIDFCVLILDKEVDRYIDNKKVFMWVN